MVGASQLWQACCAWRSTIFAIYEDAKGQEPSEADHEHSRKTGLSVLVFVHSRPVHSLQKRKSP